jgi:hypothetical protein
MTSDVTREQHLERARQDLRATLYAYHASGTVPFVEVANASATDRPPCRACKELHGRRFTIEDAIAREILPCPECTGGSTNGARGFCRCDFLPVQEQRRRPREKEEQTSSWLRRFLDF